MARQYTKATKARFKSIRRDFYRALEWHAAAARADGALPVQRLRAEWSIGSQALNEASRDGFDRALDWLEAQIRPWLAAVPSDFPYPAEPERVHISKIPEFYGLK